MNYYLYILQCSDATLYTGITNDVASRVWRHNKGDAAKYTYSRRPVRLIYSEECGTLKTAMQRERQVKGWSRVKKIAILNLTV